MMEKMDEQVTTTCLCGKHIVFQPGSWDVICPKCRLLHRHPMCREKIEEERQRYVEIDDRPPGERACPASESALEEIFLECSRKYFSGHVDIKQQCEVTTLCGTFRLDFVVHCRGHAPVAFECDGRDFHDPYRDEWRDAMILGKKAVAAIWRIRGSDLFYHAEDVFLFLSKLQPEFFSACAHVILRRAASAEAANAAEEMSKQHSFMFSYEGGDGPPHILWLKQRCQPCDICPNPFWVTYYEFAKELGGGSLEWVIERFREDNP